MVRKVNIIRSLRMMGYSVAEDSGIFSIALSTGSGNICVVFFSEEDLLCNNFIVEEIVSKINSIIVRDF